MALRLFITQINRTRRPLGRFHLFTNALEHQHIGIHRHPDGQHDPGNARQGQRRADETQQAKDQTDVHDQGKICKNAKDAIAQDHVDQHQCKGDKTGQLARLDTIGTQFWAHRALFEEIKPRRQRACAQEHRKLRAVLDIEIAGNDPRSAGNVALDHWRTDDLAIENDGKGIADVFSRVIAEFARARGIEAEGYRRSAILVEIGLRIDQFLAGHDWRTLEDVVNPTLIERGQYLVTRPRRCIGTGRAAYDRLKGQLRRGPDQRLQLGGTADPRHLNQNPVRPLPLNCRLARAHLVDPATDDFQRLPHGAVVGGTLFGLAEANDDIRAVGGHVDVVTADAGQ